METASQSGYLSTYSSQIFLKGAIDSFSLCGNVYTADTGHTDVTFTPQYVFDLAKKSDETKSIILQREI